MVWNGLGGPAAREDDVTQVSSVTAENIVAKSHENALKISLQALAQPAEFQRQLLSVWRDEVSELPERFVQAERHLVRGQKVKFAPAQAEAIATLHSLFQSFSGPDNAEHWQTCALDWSPNWASVRRAAAWCLDAFGWDREPPPLELDVYGDDYSE